MTATNWRDNIKIHPAAELFPMMSADELAALGKDIEDNGLGQKIKLWTPEKWAPHRRGYTPKERYILDGRNRLEAIARAAKDPEACAEAIKDALYVSEEDGGAVQLWGDTDPYDYVVSANLHRRHLTQEQTRELIAGLLKAKPDRSDRATAGIARVDHKTVAVKRKELETTGEIPQYETRVGADGIKKPAKKPRAEAKRNRAPEAEPTEPPAIASAPPPHRLDAATLPANGRKQEVNLFGESMVEHSKASVLADKSVDIVSMRIPCDPKKAAAVIAKRWSADQVRDLITALTQRIDDTTD